MMIWIFGLAALLLVLHLLMVVAVAEISVHPPVFRRCCDTDGMALHVAKAMGATAERVKMQAADGVTLSAWWMQLPDSARLRDGVLLCHGVADTAFGVMGAALMYLRNGYSVLAPDNRGHGGSGGFVTYGVRESHDVTAWQRWMTEHGMARCFGFGESLGASSLLQSLMSGAKFSAIIAECPFSSFHRVACDRVSRLPRLLLPRTLADVVCDIWVKEILFYLRLRYRVDLALARPVDAVRSIDTPILLIHGTGDHETPVHHSEEIFAANPDRIRLWLVEKAEHTGGYPVEPVEFERQVMALREIGTA
jgi:fermentation-respiration switch protein FrsA (DUF1100 family)